MIIASTQNLTNDISIKSFIDAERNDIIFSFVRPTSAAKKLKAPRKHLPNWMHSVMYSTPRRSYQPGSHTIVTSEKRVFK